MLHCSIRFVAVILFASLCSSNPISKRIVNSGNAVYVGIETTKDVVEFRGVQYAHNPTERLRFARPLPFYASGVFGAYEYSPGCPQSMKYATSTGLSEDCLYLNIVRPVSRIRHLLPVLVFIHGGANNNGQASLYNGTALVSESVRVGLPIVYVAMNYRLNGFGFLASKQLLNEGNVNLGLHDQQLALKWIKDHIEDFGGDPQRIMLVGESAGSVNVWYHLTRAVREQPPFFHAASMLSGAPGGLWPHVDDAALYEPAFENLAVKIGCNSTIDPLKCLRNLPFDVLNSVFNAIDRGWERSFKYSTGIVRDNYWYNASASDDLTLDGIEDIPLIIGFNKDEGTRFFDCSAPFVDVIDLANQVSYALNDSEIDWSTEILNEYHRLDSMVDTYINTMDTTQTFINAATIAFFTDLWFAAGTWNVLQMTKSSRNVWGYRFDQTPPPSAAELPYGFPGTPAARLSCMGAYHSSSLSYFFGDVKSLADASSEDVALSSYIIKRWLKFAYYSNPNGENGSELPIWEEFDKQERVIRLVSINESSAHMTKHAFRDSYISRIISKVRTSDNFFTFI